MEDIHGISKFMKLGYEEYMQADKAARKIKKDDINEMLQKLFGRMVSMKSPVSNGSMKRMSAIIILPENKVSLLNRLPCQSGRN